MGSQPFVAVEGRSEPVFSCLNPAGSLLSSGATCGGPWTNGDAGDRMTDGVESPASSAACVACLLTPMGNTWFEEERSLLQFLYCLPKADKLREPWRRLRPVALCPSLPAGQGAEADAKMGDAHTMHYRIARQQPKFGVTVPTHAYLYVDRQGPSTTVRGVCPRPPSEENIVEGVST
ncbi:uncharacterized protein LY79DRAFT_337298 [Colletotrichum navitas]|uniref:Uncharacterized protein n=1 Tax=Colletotrichum navitas TaxID=681940 RepID=A0AAD8PS48_9PEZI|nr:uncharacterized protein LY79DRAFT_337298 [Colletotrichum navitas]KAK1579721.1 hypothetical protein LY79DRAFT_337298 [Colletotrichum navitas]